jgi:anaerobic magnesium-protoporphyrin IX monomethyl ester cyclase
MASIALVEPQAPGYHVYSFAALPRLGLPSIGAVLRDLGHQVRIYCQGLTGLPLAEILKADLVGISTTTSTAPEAYRIADLCRSHGLPVLLGGVHATFEPQEALQHADCCVIGEAEDVIGEVVERLLEGTQPPIVDSAALGPAGETGVCRVADLDALPFPDLSLIQGWRAGSITPMVTSRGCPYDCSFCSVTPMFGRRYRFRSTELVLEELSYLQPRRVFFYDDNFAASPRRTRELLEDMLRLPRPPDWMAQVRADITSDRELVALMQASGCSRVFIGYESISPAVLDSYNKQLSVEQILESVRILHEHGIKVHGMFVLGADEDDESTIRQTLRFALQHALDSVQFLILTPLPGTRMFELLERAKRIFLRDWSLYDGHHVVYEPLKIKAATLQREAWKAQKRFYSAWECLKAFARLRFGEGILKAYARAIIGRWERRNVEFLKLLGREASIDSDS